MFADHPLVGVGLGSFSKVASASYASLLPEGGGYTTESHTAIVTVLAELGVVGAALLAWLALATYRAYRRASRSSDSVRPYAAACFVALVAVVGSAQAEGNMLESPLLWTLLGMLVAVSGPVAARATRDRLTVRSPRASGGPA
jgi:O-antigen ligase